MLSTKTTKTLRFNIDTEEIFHFIARNNGVSLTDIVSNLYPQWKLDKWSKQAIHGMMQDTILEGDENARVYQLRSSSDKRVVLYFVNCKYKETSKRVIFANFIRQMKEAKW
tara:strand:- start:128 stop:460 length:333 start_codon:yes stop_codon:yes gene_type:complete